MKATLSCLTLRDPHGLYSPWNSPGQNTGVGSRSRLQGNFPTQGLNPGLPHCRRILYQLSHKGSPLRCPNPVTISASPALPRIHLLPPPLPQHSRRPVEGRGCLALRVQPCLSISSAVLGLGPGRGRVGSVCKVPSPVLPASFLRRGRWRGWVLGSTTLGNLALHLGEASSRTSHLISGPKRDEARAYRQRSRTQAQGSKNHTGACPADDRSGASAPHVRNSSSRSIFQHPLMVLSSVFSCYFNKPY